MTAPRDTDGSQTDKQFFRCPVQSEKSEASIRIGLRTIKATVQETSIDGFTVLVTPKQARQLKVGRRWVLSFDDAKVEVHPQWFFNAPDGQVQMGLRQLRDVTKIAPLRRSLWSRLKPRQHQETSATSTVAFGGLVLALVSVLSLPGLGDRLGTASRIQKSVRWFVTSADTQLDEWTR